MNVPADTIQCAFQRWPRAHLLIISVLRISNWRCTMAHAVTFRWVLGRISALFIVASLLAGVAAAQQTVPGVTANGALYQFIVPSPWNGQLIIYAHGAVPA